MHKVARNAIWIIGGKVIQSVLALIINMLTARYLGPSNFGLITYASSLVAFVLPIMQLGFSDVLVQEIIDRHDSEGKILGTAIPLNIGSSICCIIGVVSFAFAVNPNEPETVAVCFLYSFILVFQALDQIVYWYQAKLMSKYTSMVGLFAYVVVSAYKIYLLVTAKSIYWFAISNAFDYALISVGGLILYHKLGGERFSFSWALGKSMFSRSKHYIVSSMMVTIFAQTDKIMINMMLGEASTGYYGAAVTCACLTSFVFTAIIDSFRPSVFEGQKVDETVFKKRLAMLYSIIIYLSLAQSIAMTILSKWIILILYGNAYSPAINALRIVVWYTTFSYMGAVRNIWILAKEKQRYLWQINLSGATANVVLNALLIPVLGINGAAIASLVTQFFTNVVMGYILKPIRPNNRIIIDSLNPGYILNALKKFRRHSEI